jgi:hypothetical protein
VKASSGNLSGDEGAGRSISARAVASIVGAAAGLEAASPVGTSRPEGRP